MTGTQPGPTPPPWGILLKRTRESWQPRKLSMRAASERAGVAETTWRHAEGGYEVKAGHRLPYRVGASTLAHMALAVGISPAALRGADREDAAVTLADLIAQAAEPPPLVPECDHERRLLDSKEISAGEKRRRVMAHRDEGHRDWCGQYAAGAGGTAVSLRA